MKKIRYEDIKQVIQTELAREEALNNLHKTVAGILSKWEGKKITARIKTQIQEALPPLATVMYEPPSTFSGKVTIYGVPGYETYDKRVSFYLRPVFTAAGFEDDNRSSGRAAAECIARRVEMLKIPTKLSRLADAINELNAAREAVEKQIEEFESDKYAIERFSGLRDDRNRLY